jgi:hypothetical protein
MIEGKHWMWWQVCTPWKEIAYSRFKPKLKKVISSRLQDDPFGNWRYTLAIL